MSSELAELFDRNPLFYSDMDTATVVKKMRENRATFELGLKTPVGERKTPAKAAKAGKDLLKDLGL